MKPAASRRSTFALAARPLRFPWTRTIAPWSVGAWGVALLLGASACGSSNPTSPSGPKTVSTFFANSTASDGTVATINGGTAPAPSGGPSISVTAPGVVVGAGTEVVRVTSVTPFQKVFVSVEGSSGFLQFSLKSSTTDVTLVTTIGSSLPAGSFTVDYQVALAGGAVGPVSSVATTGTASSAPSANVTGTWTFQGTPVFTLSQSGAAVSGNEIFASMPAGVTITGTLQGTVSGSTFSGTNAIAVQSTDGSNVSCSQTSGFVMIVSGSTMSGTYTTGTFSCNIPGLSDPGGVPFSITLIKQ